MLHPYFSATTPEGIGATSKDLVAGLVCRQFPQAAYMKLHPGPGSTAEKPEALNPKQKALRPQPHAMNSNPKPLTPMS